MKYLNAVTAHNEATSRRDRASRELERAEEACRQYEAREIKNLPDLFA